MKHFTTPYFNLIQLLGTLCIFSILWHCEREIDTTELTKAKERSIQLEERLRLDRLQFEKALSLVASDTIITEIESKQNADETSFNNRIVDIVGLDAYGTIENANRVVSKGDSIRSGHLDLVHPR